VKSEAFREYFCALQKHYEADFPVLAKLDLDEIAAIIVGAARPERTYLADIIPEGATSAKESARYLLSNCGGWRRRDHAPHGQQTPASDPPCSRPSDH